MDSLSNADDFDTRQLHAPQGMSVANSPSRNEIKGAIAAIPEEGTKYGKAVEYLIRDREVGLAFYALPDEHWKKLANGTPSKNPV